MKVLYVATVPALLSYSSRIVELMMSSNIIEAYALFFLEKSSRVEDNELSLYQDKDFTDRVGIRWLSKNVLLKNLSSGRYVADVKNFATNRKITTIHFLSQDVIVAPNLNSLRKFKLVYTVHDVIHHETNMSFYQRVLHSILLIYREQIILKKINNLVSCSSHQVFKLKMMFPSKNVYLTDMPSLVTESIKRGVKTLQELVGVSNYILFFGRIEIYKGIELLYNAYCANTVLQSLPLVIAGKGNIYFKRSSHERNIIFVNRFIQDEELGSLFKNAFCSVLPYRKATQSAVTSLSYYYNIPVVVSDTEGLKESVVAFKTGLLFKSGVEESLAAKLQTLIEDKILYHSIKRSQVEMHKNIYDEDRLKASFEAVYR